MPEPFKVVTVCGSMRFAQTMVECARELSVKGYIVLMPFVTFTADERMLDAMHFTKIDMSESIFVVNVGGYIGQSTNNEIRHAVATGKTVRYLEPQA